MRRVLPWLRFGLGMILLALGLLAILPCPVNPWWYASLAMAEWGYWLFLPALLLAAPRLRPWPARAGLAAAFLGVLAGWVPVFTALSMAGPLRTDLEHRFPGPVLEGPVVSVVQMFLPLPSEDRQRHTLAYDPDKGLELELWTPGTEAAPTVVVVHGGSWRRGTRNDFGALSAYLCSRGYTVASVDYSLAPDHRFPEPLEDVRKALGFLAQRPEVDRNRVVLLGRSAGAQLAMLAAYADPSVRGVVSYYGPVDMKWSWDHPSNPEVLDSTEAIGDFLGGHPEAVPAIYEQASPLAQATAVGPPTLLLHSTGDDMVFPEQSRMLKARLDDLGVPCLLLEIPGSNHGFDLNPVGPAGQLSSYALEWFLEWATAPPTTGGL